MRGTERVGDACSILGDGWHNDGAIVCCPSGCFPSDEGFVKCRKE